MNNVVSIIVDSVISDYVGTKICKVSPTPFLDSLREESVFTENMYSPAPFTDAATKSLFTGRDCLDDYSFFFRYNTSPCNHYKTFYENGFETIGIVYPYYCTGQSVTKYIDHLYYASPFDFNSEWFGVYEYFSDIIKNRSLSDVEFSLLEKRFEMMMDVWLKFYHDIECEPDSAFMIKKCLLEDFPKDKSILDEVYKDYKNNKREYLLAFLKEGKNHKLAHLSGLNFDAYVDKGYILNKVFRKYKKEFKLFSSRNFKVNLKKNHPSIKRLMYAIGRAIEDKDMMQFAFLANFYLSITSFRRMRALSQNDQWQPQQSSYRHFMTAEHAIRHRNGDKPFYLSVHVEEPHNNIACFTYDAQEDGVLNEEIMCLKDYVNSLGEDFCGDLSYILSIRYVDYQIEKFCNFLKSNNLWDNTTLLICADHGSSYSFYPLHNNHVNCFDDECYHIPMIIRHPGLQGYTFKSYCNSKDILPTLVDIVGLPQDKFFQGHSIINYSRWNDYVITEYPGGGCPDVKSKTLWLSIRDDKYVLAYKININQDMDLVAPDTIYDLIHDPHGLYNIAKKIEIEKVEYLKSPLKDYFMIVKKRTNDFLQTINPYD